MVSDRYEDVLENLTCSLGSTKTMGTETRQKNKCACAEKKNSVNDEIIITY